MSDIKTFKMKYLISTNSELQGSTFVCIVRVYNSNIVSDPTTYKCEAGEYFSNEKPENIDYDFSN